MPLQPASHALVQESSLPDAFYHRVWNTPIIVPRRPSPCPIPSTFYSIHPWPAQAACERDLQELRCGVRCGGASSLTEFILNQKGEEKNASCCKLAVNTTKWCHSRILSLYVGTKSYAAPALVETAALFF